MKRIALTIAATLLLNLAGMPPANEAAALETSPATADELDRLLAPVALYPDQLLAQMLLCAANPAKVAAFDEWLASHQSATGTALQDAARASGFEPSFVALALFPEVVQTMAGRLDWTTKLGEAFAADRSAVFASIQRLRAKARDAGTLKTTPQQEVETKTTSSGQQVIVIEPANPQVVYVPQYDSQVVYTQPATSSTVVIQKEDDDDAEAAVAGLIGFTAGVAIGAAMDNNYYYGPYGWHGGAYMYNDAWDDWYDDREDAREDWYDIARGCPRRLPGPSGRPGGRAWRARGHAAGTTDRAAAEPTEQSGSAGPAGAATNRGANDARAIVERGRCDL